MISAPSEMRCSEMPVSFMTTKVIASTSGMATATTMPGRQPSARKLTASTMAIASIRLLVNSPTASCDDVRLVGDEVQVDADRQVARQLGDPLP